jgi:pimeloyl-ACP methyl ester carboxylesterase
VLAVGLGTWSLGGGGVDVADPGVPQDRPGPVLLIPGYGGSPVALESLAARLRAEGRTATVVELPGDGTGDLREAARAVSAAADAALAGGAPSVDVVGYSAGGVVARIWAADLGGAEQARRIVTLGSPHAGTDVARFALALAPGACPTACQQLVPGSPLLTELPAAPDGPVWTSVWSSVDQVVTPPDSARLGGATNIEIQAVCADDRAEHGQLPTDPAVVGVVLRALDTRPLPGVPAPAECAALRAG